MWRRGRVGLCRLPAVRRWRIFAGPSGAESDESSFPGLFLLIFVLYTLQFKFKMMKAKHRCCDWDSNLGPHDGMRRRIQWAMGAAQWKKNVWWNKNIVAIINEKRGYWRTKNRLKNWVIKAGSKLKWINIERILSWGIGLIILKIQSNLWKLNWYK